MVDDTPAIVAIDALETCFSSSIRVPRGNQFKISLLKKSIHALALNHHNWRIDLGSGQEKREFLHTVVSKPGKTSPNRPWTSGAMRPGDNPKPWSLTGFAPC